MLAISLPVHPTGIPEGRAGQATSRSGRHVLGTSGPTGGPWDQDAKTQEGVWMRRGGSDAGRGSPDSGSAREFATGSVLLSLVPSSEQGLAMTPHVHLKRAPGFSLVLLSLPFSGQCIPNRPPWLGFLLFLSPMDPKRVPKMLPRCLSSLSHPFLSPGRLLHDYFLCTMFERSLQATAIWKSSYYKISINQELFFLSHSNPERNQNDMKSPIKH